MIGTVGLKQLRIDCVMGVYDFEHEKPQPLLIDIELDYDFAAPSSSDEVKDAIDYDTVATTLTQIVHQKVYKLLEAYAADCIQALFSRFPAVSRILLEVHKPQAVAAAQASFVRLEQTKDR